MKFLIETMSLYEADRFMLRVRKCLESRINHVTEIKVLKVCRQFLQNVPSNPSPSLSLNIQAR